MSALVANLLTFARALRRAGLPVSLEQVLALLRALEWVDLGVRAQVYHATRALLVSRHEDLALFDAAFDRFFARHRLERDRRRPPAPAPKARGTQFTVVDYLAFKSRREDPELPVGDRARSYSPDEVLRRKAFAEMSAEELRAVGRLIAALRFEAAERVTRRRVADPRGRELDLRRALRAAARHGAMPARLPRRRRRIKARPLVLLADVSGSMERHARAVLQLFFALSQSDGGRAGGVECFVFGTRLTRITHQLRLRDPDRALDAAAAAALDFSGGTRIGASLAAFNRRWAPRVLRRGAVVVVVSDGWERGDAGSLGAETARLQRRCHRLIWLNPHLGSPGYRPLAAGMAAALPFVDDFLPVHDLASLEQLAAHLHALPGRPRGALVPVSAKEALT